MMKHLFFNLVLLTTLMVGLASCSGSDSDSDSNGDSGNYSNYYIEEGRLKVSDVTDNIQYSNNEALLRQGKLLDYGSNKFIVYHIVNSTTIERITIRYELSSTSWDNDGDDGNVIYPFYKENIGGYYLYFFKEDVVTYSYVKSEGKMGLTNGNDAEVFTLNSDGFSPYDNPSIKYIKWNIQSSNAPEISPDSLSNQTVDFGTKINFIRSNYGPDAIVNGQTYSVTSKYQKTGSNTGKIVFNYSANNVYTSGVVLLTFSTATSGTYEYTATANGTSTTTNGNFSISGFTSVLAPTSITFIGLDDNDVCFNIESGSTCMLSVDDKALFGTYTYTKTSNASATFTFTPNASKYEDVSSYKYTVYLNFKYRRQGTYTGKRNLRDISGTFGMNGNY